MSRNKCILELFAPRGEGGTLSHFLLFDLCGTAKCENSAKCENAAKCEKQSTLNVKIPLNVKNLR